MLFHFFFNWQLSEKSVNDEGFVVFNFRQFHEFPKKTELRGILNFCDMALLENSGN